MLEFEWLQVFCKADFASLLAIVGYWKLFSCFDVNLGNTGRMELFSMPRQSDLVKSFIFGRGRTQIPR